MSMLSKTILKKFVHFLVLLKFIKHERDHLTLFVCIMRYLIKTNGYD